MTHRDDGARRLPNHGLDSTAQQELSETAPPTRPDHDQVWLPQACDADDLWASIIM